MLVGLKPSLLQLKLEFKNRSEAKPPLFSPIFAKRCFATTYLCCPILCILIRSFEGGIGILVEISRFLAKWPIQFRLEFSKKERRANRPSAYFGPSRYRGERFAWPISPGPYGPLGLIFQSYRFARSYGPSGLTPC